MKENLADIFSEENLKDVFINRTRYSSSVGLDRITSKNFENKLSTNISFIRKKIFNYTYKFTPYKEALILKGRNQNPRVISIPTIKDQLVIKLLSIFLQNHYDSFNKFKLSQTLISEIIKQKNSGKYNYYIKLDISNFFGTINHEILFYILKENKIDKKIIKFINTIITTPTVDFNLPKHSRETFNLRGVPQGLSISNILASYYLLSFDKKYQNNENFFYTRYVDDILIFCSQKHAEKLNSQIKNSLSDLKLEINSKKNDSGVLNQSFKFLGYEFSEQFISPRIEAMRRVENSLENFIKNFSKHKDKNYKLFLWSINLKITGTICDNKKYGWLFYFSQITNKKVLFHLDWFINKMFKRFGINLKIIDDIRLKKFVRAYNEITLNLNHTKYIPHLDKFTFEDKKKFLSDIANFEPGLTEDETNNKFKQIIFKQLATLEKDIQNFS